MRKLSLAIAAVLAVVAALCAPSLVARAQNPMRFEYLRVTPFQSVTKTPGHVIYRWAGYSACMAASAEWTCRQFEGDGINAALRDALATLGQEGWELVSAVDERHDRNSEFGGFTIPVQTSKTVTKGWRSSNDQLLLLWSSTSTHRRVETRQSGS